MNVCFKTTPMKVLTFNTALLDVKNTRTQVQQIVNHLQDINPDVVLFQEIVYTVVELLVDEMDQIGYYTGKEHIDRVEQNPCGYDTMVFAKKELEGEFGSISFYDSFMGRGISYFVHDGIVFMSSHLESTQTPPTIENRKKQLGQLSLIISNLPKVILGMDANTKYQLNLPEGAVDLWADHEIPTWHGNRYFNIQSDLRYDRFVLKGFAVVTREIDTFHEISDHDALIVTF